MGRGLQREGWRQPSAGLPSAAEGDVFFFFLEDSIYFQKGEGREKERETSMCKRNIDQLPAFCTPPARDLAHNLGMWPDRELNWQPFGSQAVHRPAAQSTSQRASFPCPSPGNSLTSLGIPGTTGPSPTAGQEASLSSCGVSSPCQVPWGRQGGEAGDKAPVQAGSHSLQPRCLSPRVGRALAF